MDAKRKRLIADALNEATRGCTCGMGVAECDRCREVVLVEALEEAQDKLAKVQDAMDTWFVDGDDTKLMTGLDRAMAAAKVQP